jgi:hypothetical protein
MRKSITYWFFKLLSKRHNWLATLGTIIATLGFVVGGCKDNNICMIIFGIVFFSVYLVLILKAISDYKSLVDEYLNKGYSEAMSINHAESVTKE